MIEVSHYARLTAADIINNDYERVAEIINHSDTDYYDLEEPENDAFWRNIEDQYLAAVVEELKFAIARRKIV